MEIIGWIALILMTAFLIVVVWVICNPPYPVSSIELDEIEPAIDKEEIERLRHANDLLEKSGKHYLSQMQKFEADAERYRKAKELGYIREHYEREIDIAIDAAKEG